MVRSAAAALGTVAAMSPIATTPPLGPSRRRYANAAVLLVSDEAPDALLRRLKAIEQRFGRRRGRRWGDRVLDLDIILWSQGTWSSPGLTVPHVRFRERAFVLHPLAAIAPGWRDPVSGGTIRQLYARLRLRRPVDRARPRA